jgi:uncharacterized protein (DUF1800 family)
LHKKRERRCQPERNTNVGTIVAELGGFAKPNPHDLVAKSTLPEDPVMNLIARRTLIQQLSLTADAAVPEPLAPPDAVTLLLNRSSFGPRQSEYDRAKQVGFDAYLEAQLNPETLDDRVLEQAIATNLKTIAMPMADIFASYGPASDKQAVPLSELRTATILRQIHSPKQLFEVMVEFWSNHFNIEHIHGIDKQLKTADDRVIRQNALGKFKDILSASAHSPAMLYYLDNYQSVATGPNENYARELMELHTLGVNGGFSEDDVKNVAKALTGWTFDRSKYEFAFVTRNHDRTAKMVLGHALPAGRGVQDGDEVLQILAEHPSTAKLIATKLVQRFVSDAPPASLVTQIAQGFLDTGGDIKKMLRALFKSVEFAASADLKVKRPSEVIIGALRVVDATFSGTTYIRALGARLDGLGMQIFMWPAPNGYPDSTPYWINTTAWINRWNYLLALAENTLDPGVKFDLTALIGSAKTPEQLTANLATRLLRRTMTSADLAAVQSYAATGGATNRQLSATEIKTRGQDLLGILLSSRYFHYR